MIRPRFEHAVLFLSCLALLLLSPPETSTQQAVHPVSGSSISRSPRLALWLAKKDQLLQQEHAGYDLVMSGWFEPEEADSIRAGRPASILLAGLTLCWVFDDTAWINLLETVANGGDTSGPLQLTDDMFLMYDEDGDSILDTHCTPPGWDQILAVDPRHPGWRELILSFYDNVASAPQHDGVIVDMIDAYPFCDGAWSEGVPVPIDSTAWVSAQEELLAGVRDSVGQNRLVFGNAGRDFPEGSPFPGYLNGYLLENALGELFGLETVDELLLSAERACQTTLFPHIVVFAVDTDNTGEIDTLRFRSGLVSSLLLDNTLFAFDFGPADHGGVEGWWHPDYYNVRLGDPTGPYIHTDGCYSRDFDRGRIVASTECSTVVEFDTLHRDISTGEIGTEFTVPAGDGRIFIRCQWEREEPTWHTTW